MEFQRRSKMELPLMVQLLFVLAYFGMVFLLGMSSNQHDEIRVRMQEEESFVLSLKIWQIISVTILFILPVQLFVYLLRPEKFKFLSLDRNLSPSAWITALTICIVALPMVGFLQKWNAGMHLPDNWASLENWMRNKETEAQDMTVAFLADKSVKGVVINLIVVALMAAFSEELFFRGLLQGLLHKISNNKHLAVWIGAILFSAIHFQFFGFFPRLFLGAILGYLYAFTGSLWAPIVAHFVNNAFAVIISARYQVDPDQPLPDDLESGILSTAALISVLMVAAQLFFLYYKQKRATLLSDGENLPPVS